MNDTPFLRHILEDPADDAPRLIYADWLEERGDPRGEFIRVQCELTSPENPCRMPKSCCYGNDAFVERPGEGIIFCGNMECIAARDKRDALRRRERELLEAHGKGWVRAAAADVPIMILGWFVGPSIEGTKGLGNLRIVKHSMADAVVSCFCEFRRGFVAAVSLPCAAFLEHAAALFAATPIEEVRLTDREPAPGRNGRWYYYSRDDWQADHAPLPPGAALPVALCKHMAWYTKPGHSYYATAAEALAALSAACVKYGRHAAGLLAHPAARRKLRQRPCRH